MPGKLVRNVRNLGSSGLCPTGARHRHSPCCSLRAWLRAIKSALVGQSGSLLLQATRPHRQAASVPPERDRQFQGPQADPMLAGDTACETDRKARDVACTAYPCGMRVRPRAARRSVHVGFVPLRTIFCDRSPSGEHGLGPNCRAVGPHRSVGPFTSITGRSRRRGSSPALPSKPGPRHWHGREGLRKTQPVHAPS